MAYCWVNIIIYCYIILIYIWIASGVIWPICAIFKAGFYAAIPRSVGTMGGLALKLVM